MSKEIMVINGTELQVKEYNGQRVVTLWDIARLHNAETDSVRKNFKNNAQYLIEGEDYFVLPKQDALAANLIRSNEISRYALNATRDIPVFTESGYLMMSKPMTGALAWAVQRQLVKNYFAAKEMRQITHKPILSPELAVDQAKFITSLAEQAGISLESRIACVKYLYKCAGMEIPIEVPTEQKLYDLETIAKRLGILSENGKPHANAVSAIIKQMDIPESIKIEVLETNGKWTGSVTKYKEDIFGYIEKWLMENNKPPVVESAKRKFRVIYNN
ncbi:MAG: hypothetical protein HPY66_1642 [Firmicutes bacterium]|nr:hypothetical protein [Bacillota bacterium]